MFMLTSDERQRDRGDDQAERHDVEPGNRRRRQQALLANPTHGTTSVVRLATAAGSAPE